MRFAFMAALLAFAPLSSAYAGTEGVDVSHHNGPIDWAKAKASGVQFAYVKVSEGVDDPDPMFTTHWSALAEHKILRGAYHFFITEDDPAAQAKLFLGLLKPAPGELLPAIDIEVLGKGTKPDAPERLAIFISLVSKEIRTCPVIYTSARFWDQTMASDPRLLRAIANCPLWIAEYETSAPRIPKGWKSWTIWQWQSGQTISGIPGGVDRNRLHPKLTLEQLSMPKVVKKR